MFDTYWTEVFRLLMPWAEHFFRVVTELGSDYFYMALIVVGFWIVDKRGSILIALILITSNVSNYWMKITFKVPRPPQANWLLGANATNYSLPSAHAQNSTVLWGWLGIKFKTWMIGLSSVLTVLIGLSRIYIGVHWLEDILLGWAVGLFLLMVLWRLEEPARSILSKYNLSLQYLGLVVLGLAAMTLTELLSPVTTAGLEDNFGANGGLIVGLGIGLLLEGKYVNFEIDPEHIEKWRLALRVILGLIIVFATMLVLSPLLPTDIYWLRATRYALTAISAVFIWPLLFKKFHI